MNEIFNVNVPGFSADGEPLNEVPTPGVPFHPVIQSDLHKPIEVTGVLKAKIMRWFPSIDPNVTVYMWSKFSDPSWNPNDYVQFENDKVTLHYIISSCGKLYSINDGNEGMDVVSWKLVDEDFRSLAPIDEDDAIDEDEKILDEVLHMSEFNEQEKNSVKVHEAFSSFKNKCCEREKNCPQKHYFLGSGKLKVNGKKYEGIHVYVEPDYNKFQVDQIVYHDKIYQQYHGKTITPGHGFKIISEYLQQLESTVDEAFNAPFPLGKREVSRN